VEAGLLNSEKLVEGERDNVFLLMPGSARCRIKLILISKTASTLETRKLLNPNLALTKGSNSSKI
jgi:hypothetical protein